MAAAVTLYGAIAIVIWVASRQVWLRAIATVLAVAVPIAVAFPLDLALVLAFVVCDD